MTHDEEKKVADIIAEMAAAIESLQRENEELLAENGELRHIVSNCAAALLTGAFVSPKCSVDFMKDVPKEVASTVGSLRDELTGTQTANQCMTEDFSNMKARAEAAEAEVKHYRAALYEIATNDEYRILTAEEAQTVAQKALASTGGEHHAE